MAVNPGRHGYPETATVTVEKRTTDFATLQRRLVERPYADHFINTCYNLTDIAVESAPVQASIARQIVQTLQKQGLYTPAVPESQFLAAFLLYWWESFARGYAFEIEIFRDLATSGVAFTAHALHTRQQRLSRHDLTILGFRGDIKTSTYFLHVRRTKLVTQHFYITRLYHQADRQWERVVLLQEHFWRVLNGESKNIAALDKVWQIFPTAARLRLQRHHWVVVPYEWWKQRVCQIQTRRKQ
ncbi:MAG: hypothetical protein H8E35_12155 [Ardenticatenia bacterium]|nr:hypothetical protein [Ardenticatenia bacterium]